MNDTTSESLIPYDTIVQDALLGAVRATLKSIVDGGGVIPGDHHFYITFDTRVEGAQIPAHLREKFTEEMTIVLQHRFTNLKVEEDHFSVGLAFGGTPSTVIVPYRSITAFVDPSADFVLRFVTEAPEVSVETLHHDDPEGNVVTVDFGRR